MPLPPDASPAVPWSCCISQPSQGHSFNSSSAETLTPCMQAQVEELWSIDKASLQQLRSVGHWRDRLHYECLGSMQLS